MTPFCYDLHLHSCLSPCADDDMTPGNIAGMAKLAGLSIAALTDHNSAANCPPFFALCRQMGVVPVAGMELTTAEDIHLVCLFPTLERAMAFDEAVAKSRILIENRPAIFGRQLLTDESDAVVGEEKALLINATALPLSEAAALAERFDGAAYPAHIDRESNGILAVLGAMPQEPAFPTVELAEAAKWPALSKQQGVTDRLALFSSDAHNLWRVGEQGASIALDADAGDEQAVRSALIRRIRLGGRA